MYEGYSLSTLEAMALGIPVISSDLNGVFYDASLERPSLTLGRVKDITNISEVADLVEQIGEDRGFKRNLIKNGFKITEQSSWKSVAKAYEVQYEKS